MSLETATYLADLQPANPPSTDPISQGDDHLRLIKQVLQNQFQGATRQWQIPTMMVPAANTTLVKANGESVLFVNTASGPITITMPTGLTAADVGWKVSIYKYTTDSNPIYIVPAGGTTLNSGQYVVTKARRCIPGALTVVYWNGSAGFFATRASPAPPGTMLDFWGTVLPIGYEWPNGQTLVAANYPEYVTAMGTAGTPDLRGTVGVVLDNLGGAARGLLSHGYISGSVLGAFGGLDYSQLGTSNLPAYTPSGTITNGAISISQNAAVNGGGSGTPGPFTALLNAPGVATITASQGTTTFAGNPQGGSSALFSSLQPSTMIGKILVVE
jgi:hypothetical protein